MPYQRRLNFQKADWNNFTDHFEKQIGKIKPTSNCCEFFTDLVRRTARKHIPRGCLTRYVPCLSQESLNLLDAYNELFEDDPFAENTIELENNEWPQYPKNDSENG